MNTFRLTHFHKHGEDNIIFMTEQSYDWSCDNLERVAGLLGVDYDPLENEELFLNIEEIQNIEEAVKQKPNHIAKSEAKRWYAEYAEAYLSHSMGPTGVGEEDQPLSEAEYLSGLQNEGYVIVEKVEIEESTWIKPSDKLDSGVLIDIASGIEMPEEWADSRGWAGFIQQLAEAFQLIHAGDSYYWDEHEYLDEIEKFLTIVSFDPMKLCGDSPEEMAYYVRENRFLVEPKDFFRQCLEAVK